MPKRYLVTGGAGFIGSNLVDALVQRGDSVVVLDNLATGKRSQVNPAATFVEGDIRLYDFPSLGSFDGIFHLAALSRIYPSILNPVESSSVNIQGSVRVFEYARSISAKVVFASSSSVYGRKKTFPTREDSFPDIQSPYSLQKLTCDYYLDLFYRLYGLRYAIVRYFNAYGERQLSSGPYATVVGIFLNQFLHNQPFTIIGDGLAKRDFTYVQDVVLATISAIEHDAESGMYNIGTGVNHSVCEVADMIDPGHPKIYLPQRPGGYPETRADNGLARRVLGWSPTMQLSEWLQAQIQKVSLRRQREQVV
ncbi:MAG: NAD-dependent epimerase/dehydratase family protein [Planctomycetes bacterium]|nr:NAD-dependent epimerase/dehydratase family protein [Planctomycetota bacterium]